MTKNTEKQKYTFYVRLKKESTGETGAVIYCDNTPKTRKRAEKIQYEIVGRLLLALDDNPKWDSLETIFKEVK